VNVAAIALIVFGFFCGSIPFAVIVGRRGLNTDIRDYGDGNPGAFNVLRAGGFAWGGLAVILEISKGALPVGLAAYIFGIDGTWLYLISIAPPLGHAFSPFLNFKGGKAIAATGGVLIGLSLWELPLVAMTALTVWYLLLTSSGWAVMLTAFVLLIYELITQAPTDWVVSTILLTVLLAQRHRAELTRLPRIKSRLVKRIFPTATEIDHDSSDHVHNGSPDRH